jgi:hypothetical protein
MLRLTAATIWMLARAVLWCAVTLLALELLGVYLSRPIAWAVGTVILLVVAAALIKSRKKIGRR